MATPTLNDMQTTLEDAIFFYDQLTPLVRGPEHEQKIDVIRRHFRAYLHCWKCIPDFVREAKGLKEQAWIAWMNTWAARLNPTDYEAFECLRQTRNHDTHRGMIEVSGEIAAGLFPIVMFLPGKNSGPRRELVSLCERGIYLGERMIREHGSIP